MNTVLSGGVWSGVVFAGTLCVMFLNLAMSRMWWRDGRPWWSAAHASAVGVGLYSFAVAARLGS